MESHSPSAIGDAEPGSIGKGVVSGKKSSSVTVAAMEVVVHETPEEVAGAVSAIVSRSINMADRPFSLGLAGGSTPEATYHQLAKVPTDWAKVTAWLGDERWVAPDSPRSNGNMAARALFDHVPARFVRPDWSETMTAEQSAANYGRMLAELHPGSGPDLVLLGLGDDGHTASLFPGSRALEEGHHRYVANVIPETGEVRLTATYPLLNSAERILFLVVGEDKAEALASSLDDNTPAGRVGAGDTRVEWHVDRQAASRLS